MRSPIAPALGVVLLVPVSACTTATAAPRPPERSPIASLPSGAALVSHAASEAAVEAGVLRDAREPCAPGMVLGTDPGAEFCIDRFECSLERRTPSGERQPWPGNLPVDGVEQDLVAVSIPGRKPQGYINAMQSALACEHAGKRLCTSTEWLSACRGPAGLRYPYGNVRQANVCNDRFSGQAMHPVVRLFHKAAPKGTDPGTMWTHTWLNDSRLHELSDSVFPSGAFPDCVSGFGAVDMVGNLHEWVADSSGVFRGGFFMDTHQHGEGCDYRTTVHGPKYHDYSTGFRCCADVVDASE